MPTVGTAWTRPTTVSEACAAIAAARAARPVGGCTLVTPAAMADDVALRLAVDLLSIPELERIEERAGGVAIGATATLRAVALDQAVRSHAPLLAEVASAISDEVIAGLGTIGGNLAVRTPGCWDLSAAVVALGATLVVASPDGERELPADALCDPAFALAPGEILTRVEIATGAGALRTASRRATTNVRTHAVAAVAAAAGPDAVRVAVLAGTGYPQRAAAVEAALAAGGDATAAAAEAAAALDAESDALASAEYRRHVIGLMLAEIAGELAGAEEQP